MHTLFLIQDEACISPAINNFNYNKNPDHINVLCVAIPLQSTVPSNVVFSVDLQISSSIQLESTPVQLDNVVEQWILLE